VKIFETILFRIRRWSYSQWAEGFTLMVLIAGLWLWVIKKAAGASITYDEAYSFFEYVSYPEFLRSDFNFMSANNHLLNTWMTRLSYALWGNEELALRLPNVLAFGVFLYASARIAYRLVAERFLPLVVLLLFCGNPYVLDFFSLSRGYGLSLAFTTYALWQFINDNHLRALIAMMLAVLANLIVLHVFPAFVFVVVWKLWNDKKLYASVVAALAGIFMVLLLPYISQLKEHGAFIFGGGDAAFWSSLVSLGARLGGVYSNVGVGFVLAMLLIILIGVLACIRRRDLESARVVVVLIAAVLSPIVQQIFLGSPFPLDRTALFYWPLLVVALTYSIRLHSVMPGVVVVLGVVQIFFFTSNSSLLEYAEWKQEAGVKRAAHWMSLHSSEWDEPTGTVFAVNLETEQAWNYYRMRYGIHRLGQVYRTDAGIADLVYNKGISKNTSRMLYRDEYGALSKRKVTRDEVRVLWNGYEHLKNASGTGAGCRSDVAVYAGADRKYSMREEFTFSADSITQLTVRAFFKSEVRNTGGLFVVALTDSFGLVDWQATHINALQTHPATIEWTEFQWAKEIPERAKGTVTAAVYLLNTGTDRVYMDELSIRLLRERP
jgi:hypothetical protein